MLGEEGHVLPGGSAAAEAGGGLDIVRAGGGDDFAHLHFFLIGEEAALDDDLQELPPAGVLDGLDLRQQIIPLPVLHPADVDDHVHFLRAVFHRVCRHEALGRGGVVAVGEADDGADGQLAPDILRRLFHVAGGDADAGALVFHPVVADGLDLLPGGSLGQQGVVALSKDFLQFHFSVLLYNYN